MDPQPQQSIPPCTTEAGFSVNWTMTDADGAQCQMTMRADSASQGMDILRARAHIVQKARANGWTMGRTQADKIPTRDIPDIPEADDILTAPKPAANSPAGWPAGEFPAETLVCNISDGKPSWRVKGGRFAKYGITVWPEVLTAAGMDPKKLSTAETYDLAGYTAFYSEYPSDKAKDGVGRKVVRLAN